MLQLELVFESLQSPRKSGKEHAVQGRKKDLATGEKKLEEEKIHCSSLTALMIEKHRSIHLTRTCPCLGVEMT